jgi:hypothetical protein
MHAKLGAAQSQPEHRSAAIICAWAVVASGEIEGKRSSDALLQ